MSNKTNKTSVRFVPYSNLTQDEIEKAEFIAEWLSARTEDEIASLIEGIQDETISEVMLDLVEHLHAAFPPTRVVGMFLVS